MSELNNKTKSFTAVFASKMQRYYLRIFNILVNIVFATRVQAASTFVIASAQNRYHGILFCFLMLCIAACTAYHLLPISVASSSYSNKHYLQNNSIPKMLNLVLKTKLLHSTGGFVYARISVTPPLKLFIFSIYFLKSGS